MFGLTFPCGLNQSFRETMLQATKSRYGARASYKTATYVVKEEGKYKVFGYQP